MQVTINVPDQFAVEAAARGLSVDAYVEEVLAKQVQPSPEHTARKAAVDEMRKFGQTHGCTLKGLNLKDLLHEGHKY